MNVLALDFDGVISDSAVESFVVALRTYTRMRPRSALSAAASELSDASPQVLRKHPLYRGFLELMPLGNRAEDFAVALAILELDSEVVDQAAYDAQHAGQSATFLEQFHVLFYQERARFCEVDRGAWLGLLGPYPDFVSLLRRRAGDVTLALATAKDRRSVEILLDHYGIADLFHRDRVLDKEAGRGKSAHLSALSQRLDVAFPDITFVDDKVNHLEAVAGLGVQCALAAWGYNGARERALAAERGFLVCELDAVERLLFGDG